MADDSEDVGIVLDVVESSEELTEEGHLKICSCGHALEDHGCDDSDRDEFNRRARAAVRIDEFLEEKGQLLNFEYVDDDILSLRKQMELPSESAAMSIDNPPDDSDAASSSGFSDAPATMSGQKHLRSTSSLSDDDEDVPLASRQPISDARAQKRSPKNREAMEIDGEPDGSIDDLEAELEQAAAIGTKVTNGQQSGKMKSHVSFAPKAPGGTGHVNEEAAAEDAIAKAKIINSVQRSDEKQQVARLATGIAIDAAAAPTEAPPKRDRPSIIEERSGKIKFEVVVNDGSPRSSIILTGLKCLFQKQLPKMPREYITRLVFDRSAEAMAVVQKGLKVVGGIAYRPFPHRAFAEIVFFAISGVYQINGYGGHLMNHFKSYIKKNKPEIMHFLTYADNYAIGYFKKQGFTRDITLPKHLWMGYIKDYEGGTLMQCSMLRKVEYLEAREMLKAQKEAIMTKIRQLSKSHVIHSGLEVFKNAPEGFKIDPKDVPGLRESGWRPDMDEMLRRPVRNADHSSMRKLLSELQGHPDAWPFLLPVNKNEVTDYYDIVKNPMDFNTMENKLENGGYVDFDAFVADAHLVFSNCRLYNPENSAYAKRANRMEKFLKEYLTKNSRT